MALNFDREEIAEQPPEHTEAQERAQKIVDAALARGTWTENDKLEFQKQIAQLVPSEFEPVIRNLFSKMNEGKLQVVVRGSPI